jgi:phospholipid/cholesterol/gamma-HCH transport system substrate-binding protein
MKDRQLYDNLSQAAENVNCLTRQLRPVVNDVRVFTDKIARHPEQLGVRGALQRSPGIK